MKIVVKAEARSVQGTGASRRLRRAEKVPGIVYGGGKDASLVEFDHNNLWHQMKHEAFHASILDMELGAEKMQVLLRDYQMHPFKQRLLHVDFQRVAADRKIHMKVPLHFVNEEISPAVKVSSAIVSHVTTDLDITCLPKDLPEFIEVDLSALDVGNSMHVSGLKLPAGVTVVSHGRRDPVVATAVVPRGNVETEEAAAGEGAAAAAPAEEAKPAAAAKEDKKDDKKK